MKDNRLQTKRQAKTGFRAMYARTVKKRQHASTAALADDLEGDVPSVGIGRALTVILVLHIVAIAAIWVGINWQGGNNNNVSDSAITTIGDKEKDNPKAIIPPIVANAGSLSPDRPASYDLVNNPAPATQPTAAQNDMVSDRPDLGLGDTPPVRQARVIKPRRNPNLTTAAAATTSTKKYVVVSGDTFYRIAKRHNLKQAEVIAANPGVNPSKIKPGQVINVPVR